MSYFSSFAALVTFTLSFVCNQSSTLGNDENPPELLSAYLGVVDIPLPQLLEDITGCEQAVGDEGMPLVLSVQIDASTLDPEDIMITTESGATYFPTCTTLAPADEADELRTILLAGPLGSADDLPVNATIVGQLSSIDGVELNGLSSEVTLNSNGPELALAILQPQTARPDGIRRLLSLRRIQTTWQGGVTGEFNSTLGLEELLGFRIIDENGNAHIPLGFEDLDDGDNHVVLRVPPGITPVRIEVQAGTVFDPTNHPNPETFVDLVSCDQ